MGVYEKVIPGAVWAILHEKFVGRGELIACIVPSSIVALRGSIAIVAKPTVDANARQPWLVDARYNSDFSSATGISIFKRSTVTDTYLRETRQATHPCRHLSR